MEATLLSPVGPAESDILKKEGETSDRPLALFPDIIHMRKLLPRSTSSKSTGDEEEAEDSSALDSGTQAGETSGETAGEGNTDGQGDAQQEEPVSSSNKDNQTIMRFLGNKEKVRSQLGGVTLQQHSLYPPPPSPILHPAIFHHFKHTDHHEVFGG